MIEIAGLHKKFGKIDVLKEIDLNFNYGSCVSLLGPNASGKTTLLKIILGIVKPTSGNITVNGQNIAVDFTYRNVIGYMPQIGRYPDQMKVGQLIDLLKELRQQDSGFDNDLLDAYELQKIYGKTMSSLSGGTRQKVSAAIAFMFKSPILILDEPTAGLDPLSSEILKEKIKSELGEDKMIIVTSHILSDLEDISSHIVYLQEGSVHLFETIGDLFKRTSENHLPKAIANIMKNSANA